MPSLSLVVLATLVSAATVSPAPTPDAPADPPEWTVSLSAGDVVGGVVGGVHLDQGNLVGMAIGATDGLDPATDAPEPGAPGSAHVQLYVRGPAADPVFGDRYMQQVVGALDLADAYSDFALEVSAFGYDGAEVGIEAGSFVGLPAGYGLFLLDGAVQHDLRAAPYVFTYGGVRTLTLRVGRLPAPELPPSATPATFPTGDLEVGEEVTFTWDPAVVGATEVVLEVSTDGGATWTTLAAGIDPASGEVSYTLPPGLIGEEVTFRTAALNGAGDRLEFGESTVSVDYGTPGGSFDGGDGAPPFEPDLTAGTGVGVPFTGTNAASVTLYYSPDGGATWTPVAGPLANPNANLSAPWSGTFPEWTPGPGDVSYGGLFKVVLQVPRADGSTATEEVISAPVTLVPTEANWELVSGFQMVSLPFDAGAQTPADVFVDRGTGETLGSLFLYSFAPGTFYTLLDTQASLFGTGQGYWAAAGEPGDGRASGTFGRGSVEVALVENGWAMVGVPFAVGVGTEHFTFSDGVQTKTYTEAIAAFWIGSGLYTWTGDVYVDATGGAVAPWTAFWLPVFADGLTLTVAPPAPTPPSSEAVADDDPFWALLADVEHAGGGADRSTAFGVHPDAAIAYDAFDRPEPPPPPTSGPVRAFSVRPDWGVPFSQFDREAQPAPGEGETREWPLVIEAPAGEVTVTWSIPPSPDGVPALAFDLVDADGTRTPLADGETFTYEADGSRTAFSVEARRTGGVSTAAPPAGTFAATVAPNPARGPSAVLVTTAEPGDLTVAVYDALGRRVLDARRTVVAGTARVPLDTGALAPGAYVVRVEGPTGGLTRRLTISR